MCVDRKQKQGNSIIIVTIIVGHFMSNIYNNRSNYCVVYNSIHVLQEDVN